MSQIDAGALHDLLSDPQELASSMSERKRLSPGDIYYGLYVFR